jgi:hypothetical protein
MRRAMVRAGQAGLALALLLSLTPLVSAQSADDDPASRPVQLTRAQPQQAPPGAPTGQAAAPAPPRPPWVFGFFEDSLWPGPGRRFIAAECPIGVSFTIIHYCPGLPPAAELPPAMPPPVWSGDVLQCDPWFQYFPTCRRPMQPQ